MEEIRGYYIHIVVVLIIVIISLIIWPNNTKSMIKDNLGVVVSFDGYKEISILDNKDYERAIPSELNLKNTSSNNNTFKLYYKYAKTSSIDYNKINISLDNKIYNLSDLYHTEDSNYYYFLLDSYTLSSYDNSTIQTRIWTDASEGSVTSTFIAA